MFFLAPVFSAPLSFPPSFFSSLFSSFFSSFLLPPPASTSTVSFFDSSYAAFTVAHFPLSGDLHWNSVLYGIRVEHPDRNTDKTNINPAFLNIFYQALPRSSL